MRSSLAELAGATTAIVLPGTSAGGLRGLGMGEGGNEEVYNAPGKRKPIQRIGCCSGRNAAWASGAPLERELRHFVKMPGPGADFRPFQRAQPVQAEFLHREASHHRTVDHGAPQFRIAHFGARWPDSP